MTQLVVRLPEEKKQELMLIAHQQGQPVSSVVRAAIDEFVSGRKQGKGNDLLRLVKVASKYRGAVEPKDLASQYKRYLYGDRRL